MTGEGVPWLAVGYQRGQWACQRGFDESIPHSVTVLVFHSGKRVIDDGLPGNLPEGAVEGATGKFLIATEGDVALDQLR